MNRTALYIRESTDQQELSPEVQEAKARQYCALKDLDVVELLHDPATSGGKPFQRRAAAARLQEKIDAGQIDVVVAMKLDRMFRDVVDCLSNLDAWDRAGVAVHFIDMGGSAVDTRSSAGRFMLTVLAAAAEMEKNRIGERTRDALRFKKARHEPYGAMPYGWRRACGHTAHPADQPRAPLCDRLEAVPSQLETIAWAQQLRVGQKWSYRKIANELNAAGTPAARGRRWYASSVRSVLTNAVQAA